MQNLAAQYVQSVTFNSMLPDEASWALHMLEVGLEREAFTISRCCSGGSAVIKFWEPDRSEALRILSRLDSYRVS